MAPDRNVLLFLIDSVVYLHRGSTLPEQDRKRAMEADLAMAIDEYRRPKQLYPASPR